MATRFTKLQVGAVTTLLAGVVGYFAGNVTFTNTITTQALTATGSVQAAAFTGGLVTVNRATQGSGRLVVNGSSGAYLCLRDSDAGGYTVVKTLNGVVSAAISNGSCP